MDAIGGLSQDGMATRMSESTSQDGDLRLSTFLLLGITARIENVLSVVRLVAKSTTLLRGCSAKFLGMIGQSGPWSRYATSIINYGIKRLPGTYQVTAQPHLRR